MADLDLYEDLYGDVTGDVETPSSSLQPASTTPAATLVNSSESAAYANPSGPTTFSIATYENSTGPSHSYLVAQQSDASSRGAGGQTSSWQQNYGQRTQGLSSIPGYGGGQQNHGDAQSGHLVAGSGPGGYQGGAGGQDASHGSPAAFGGTKPSDMPDEGKMFIGGLNWETTDEGLKEYFSQFGPVVHCTIMRDTATGKSRGFAFLTFADPAAVNTVMVREHFLDGKTIDPKRAIPRGGRDQGGSGSFASRQPKEDIPLSSNKLFVRGMPEDATPASFKAFWNQYSNQVKIIESVLMMDRESNRHRGFGFVNLETGEDADQLLRKVPFIMEGHPLEVKKAQNRVRRDEAPSDATTNGAVSNQPRTNDGPGAGTPFDPATMVNFFKSMGPAWKTWNPSMLMGMNYAMMGNIATVNNGQSGVVGPSSSMSSLGGYGGNLNEEAPQVGGQQGVHFKPVGNYYGSAGRAGAPGPYGGPARTQRGSHGYQPY